MPLTPTTTGLQRSVQRRAFVVVLPGLLNTHRALLLLLAGVSITITITTMIHVLCSRYAHLGYWHARKQGARWLPVARLQTFVTDVRRRRRIVHTARLVRLSTASATVVPVTVTVPVTIMVSVPVTIMVPVTVIHTRSIAVSVSVVMHFCLKHATITSTVIVALVVVGVAIVGEIARPINV